MAEISQGSGKKDGKVRSKKDVYPYRYDTDGGSCFPFAHILCDDHYAQ